MDRYQDLDRIVLWPWRMVYKLWACGLRFGRPCLV